MKTKIITAMVLSLALGGAAFAQTSGGGATGTGAPGANDPMNTMKTWDAKVGQAFYTDSTMGTLRSESEIKANWANLSSEQQAKVKADCTSMSASMPAKDKGTTASTSAGSSSGTVTGQQGSGKQGADRDRLHVVFLVWRYG